LDITNYARKAEELSNGSISRKEENTKKKQEKYIKKKLRDRKNIYIYK